MRWLLLFLSLLQCTASATASRPAVDAQMRWESPAAHTTHGPAPISLTSSDGNGLDLTHLDVNAVVEDPMAFTELHLTFDNPHNRVIEGRFEITLPPGAVVSRFAMKINGQWQEGEVVEKRRAQRIYDDFLHRRQDPALLTVDPGNRFSARVFPIAANANKELLISYTAELAALDQPFVIPVHGLPKMEHFSADIDVHTWGSDEVKTYTVQEKDFVPKGDLTVTLSDGGGTVGVRNGDLVAARIRPIVDAPFEPIDALTVLFDTSASTALDFDARLERLEGLNLELSNLNANFSMTVVPFDQTVGEPLIGPLLRIRAALNARGPLGASDLEGALDWFARFGTTERVLLLSDMVATAGATESADLAAVVNGRIARLDVLLMGGHRDEALAHTLVTSSVRDGVAVPPSVHPEDAAQRLTTATRSNIEVHIPGALWVWPSHLDGVQSLDPFVVYARMANDAAPVEIRLDGARLTGPARLAPATRPLLERAVVRAQLAALQHRADAAEGPPRQAIIADMVALSEANRVLCRYTALLVLETEADYDQYGIDRRALADILVVREGQVALQQRSDIAVTKPVDRPFQPRKESKKDEQADSGSSLIPFDDGGLDDNFEVEEDGHGGGEVVFEAQSDLMPPVPAERAVQQEIIDTVGMVNSGRGAGAEPRPASGSHEPYTVALAIMAPDHEESEAEPNARPGTASPWTGDYATVMSLLGQGQTDEAARFASAEHRKQPTDVPLLLGLGKALHANGDLRGAARAYGSLVDLFPARADIRRAAAEHLAELDTGNALAIDSLSKSVEQRPDHLSGQRLLAWALVQAGQLSAAFDALETAFTASNDDERTAGLTRVLREDLGLVAAALLAELPHRQSEITARLATLGIHPANGPSLRMTLTWETDANDVDLHVYDDEGGHAWYSSQRLPSGGELFADVTTGYGPENFAVSSPGKSVYDVGVHYYRRGPMGYGMGTLQVIRLDEKGTLAVEDRPFVIMNDDAWLDLGRVEPQ